MRQKKKCLVLDLPNMYAISNIDPVFQRAPIIETRNWRCDIAVTNKVIVWKLNHVH